MFAFYFAALLSDVYNKESAFESCKDQPFQEWVYLSTRVRLSHLHKRNIAFVNGLLWRVWLLMSSLLRAMLTSSIGLPLYYYWIILGHFF